MFKRQACEVWAVLTDRRGVAMVEYALLMALISLVASLVLTTLGTNMKTMFLSLAGRI